MAAIAGNIPAIRIGDVYCRKALAEADALENPANFAHVAIVTAVFLIGAGRLAQAHQLFEKSSEISQNLGDHRRWFDAGGNLTITSLLRGEFQVTKALRVRLEETANRLDDARYRSAAIRTRAITQLLTGGDEDLARCCDDLEVLRTETAPLERNLEEFDRLAYSALRLVRLRRYHEALDLADQAASVSSKISVSHTFYTSLFAYAAVAEVATETWGVLRAAHYEESKEKGSFPSEERLHDLTRNACKSLLAFSRIRKIGEPLALLHQGRFLWLNGDNASARRLWRRSRGRASEIGMPYYEGLASFEIGRSLLFDKKKASEYIDRAAHIFKRLGTSYDLRRVEDVLRSKRRGGYDERN